MTYMPYAEKCALVKSVIDSTSYVDVNGKKMYQRNTNSMLFVFTMKLIESYTNLEWEPDKVVVTYDMLMESGIMHHLMDQIPEEEISMLHGMLDMQRDDVEENTRSLVSFLETKADAMQLAFDGFSSALEKFETQNKISE